MRTCGLFAAVVLLLAPLGVARAQSNAGDEAARKKQEDELERVFRSFLSQCNKMYDRQAAIHAALLKLPQANSRRAALRLAYEQRQLVEDMNAIIELLNKHGSAIAFTEVFEQLRDDMKLIDRRLRAGDSSPSTEAISLDIVEILREMLWMRSK
jgi:hypothetical protein